jgi:hypothetical protein
MASTGKSKAERVSRWRSLITNEAELLAEMPHLERDLAALREMEGEASELFAEIANLRSQTRDAVQRLQELTRHGDLLRTRIAAAVRGQFGFENAMLLKYGLEPRPPRAGFRHRQSRSSSRAARAGGGDPSQGGPGAAG